MKLTVVGSSGTWPNDGTATSGYLVQHDGFNLYLDAGTGTLANLQQHIALPDIHAIAITHEHPDHFVDLYPTFYALFYGELGVPGLPVVVPLEFAQKLADVVSIDSQVAMRSAFDLRDVPPGDGFELGPFRVKTETSFAAAEGAEGRGGPRRARRHRPHGVDLRARVGRLQPDPPE